MRILRASFYGPDLEPITMVTREQDLTVAFEYALAEIGSPVPGGYTVTDVFELDDDVEIVEATLRAEERRAEVEEDERNAAMLYHWDAAELARVTTGGVLTGTKPAPLSAMTVRSVLSQLALHPNYKGQLVIAIAEDWTVVEMRYGKVEEVKP